jgi:hypothetical protein
MADWAILSSTLLASKNRLTRRDNQQAERVTSNYICTSPFSGPRVEQKGNVAVPFAPLSGVARVWVRISSSRIEFHQ